MARRGYGDAAIRADLRKRLIPSETISGAVSSLEPEVDRALRLLETEMVSPKALRRLASRGFSRETLEEMATPFAQ